MDWAERTTSVITSPCVVDGMPEETYHQDPVDGGSLSSTGARQMAVPAKYKAAQGARRVERAEFDFGSAAHKVVLGAGQDLHIIMKAPGVPADNMLTKAAKEDKAAARAAHKIPIMADDYQAVHAMAAAVDAHPLAAQLLRGDGVSERSLFWIEPVVDVWCRARLDRWALLPSGRWVAVDYKTTTSVRPRDIDKDIRTWGYWQQDDFYRRGIRGTGLDSDPAFMFVFQEKTPPYLIQVVQLSAQALMYGHQKNRQALERFRDCRTADIWPGYDDAGDILTVELPSYLANDLEW